MDPMQNTELETINKLITRWHHHQASMPQCLQHVLTVSTHYQDASLQILSSALSYPG